MRISSDLDHRDYNPHAIHSEVYLNGVKQTHCVFADEELGTIVRIKLDEHNQPVQDYLSEQFVRETVHGNVVIVIKMTNGLIVYGNPNQD